MRFSQTLLFTPIAAGRARGSTTLQVSVVLSPRLDVGADGRPVPLSELPTELVSWGEHAEALRWERASFTLSDRTRELSGRVVRRVSRVAPALWPLVFPKDTPVKSWALSVNPLRPRLAPSIAAGREAGQAALRGLWAAYAQGGSQDGGLETQAGEAPWTPQLTPEGWTRRRFEGLMLQAMARLSAATARGKPLSAEQLPKEEREALAASLSLDAHSKALLAFRLQEHPVTARAHSRPPKAGELELHERLSLLAEHPLLLRALGLVADLEVDFPALTDVMTKASLTMKGPFKAQTHTRVPTMKVATRITLDAARVRPKQDGDVHESGYLRLDDEARYGVTQVDLHQLARDLEAHSGGRPPELRTVGPRLYRRDRPAAVLAREARAAELDAELRASPQGPIELFAEDLVRGLRLDVKAGEGPWRSLCRREVGYAAREARWSARGEEEGVITEASDHRQGQTAAGGEVDLEWTDEVIAKWEGWSLAVPRPGTPMGVDGRLEAPPLDSRLGVQLKRQPSPGSLPRLRFGETYRLRARWVDLAGHSLPWTDDDDAHATAPLTWHRLEASPPPVRVDAVDPLPGAGASRLVIRSGDDPSLSQQGAMWFIPARAGWDLIERHGLLDPSADADAERAAHKSYALLSARGGPAPDARADGRAPSLDAWLHDPTCTQLGLWALDGAPLPEGERAWVGGFTLDGQRWPAAAPLTLRLRAAPAGSPGEAWFSDRKKQLLVALPPGRAARYALAAPLDPSDSHSQVVWSSLLGPVSGGGDGGSQVVATSHQDAHPDKEALRRAAALLALAAPQADLELVHASQRPLVAPALHADLLVRRADGETDASFQSGRFDLDLRSTAELSLVCRWSEPRDAPEAPEGVVWEPREAVAWRVDVPNVDGALLPFEVNGLTHPQRWPDTKHRRVRYLGRATSRFADCFPAGTDCALEGPELARHVVATRRPAPPAVAMVLPAFIDEVGHTAITLHTQRRGLLRVCCEGPWFSSGEDERLAVVFARSREVPAALAALVSRWGHDPTTPLAQLPGAAPTLDDLDLALVGGTAVSGVQLPGVAEPVDLAVLPVRFDPLRRWWVADLPLAHGRAEWPLVRLSVVRWQPFASSPSVQPSEPALAGFAQPAPERRVELIGGGQQRMVRVLATEGGAPYEAGFGLRLLQSSPGTPGGWAPLDPSQWSLDSEGPGSGDELWRARFTLAEGAAGLAVEVREWRAPPSAVHEGFMAGKALRFAAILAL